MPRRTPLLRLALGVLLALALGGCESLQVSLRPGDVQGPLQAERGHIRTSEGDPVLLRGFNVIPIWSDRPGATWSAEHYQRISAAGLNVVRFVLHWDDLEPQPGQFDEERLQTLDLAIDRARAAGLFVVLDCIHAFEGEARFPAWARTGEPLATLERHAAAFVTALAERYRDDHAVAAYDLVNEPPSHPPDQPRVLRMYDTLIRAVRRVDPDKLVMVSPAFGDTVITSSDLRALRARRNVAFTLHDYYAGGAGDGYGRDGAALTAADGAAFTWDGTTGYPRPARDEMEQHLLRNVEPLREAGFPVWIGEFGVGLEAENARAYIRDKVALYERHELGYAWWLYDEDDAMSPLGSDGRFHDFVADLARPE